MCRRWLPALLVPLVLTACSDRPGDEVIIWRLADTPAVQPSPSVARLQDAAPAPGGPARAIINDERHFTFGRPTLEFVYHDPTFQVPALGPVTLETGVPADQAGCEQLLAQVTMAAESSADEQWLIGRCAGPPERRGFVVQVFPVPAMREQTVDLWVHVEPVPSADVQERTFVIGRVPAGARFTFAYGIERPGWNTDASAVTFHVLAEGEAAPLFFARLDPALNPSQRRWFTAAIDLEKRAGRPLRLVLQTALERAADRRPFSMPVWGDPTLLAATRERPRWNVLMISLDTLRARSLSTYGRERPTSPFFDALAREGTLFEHAVAPSSNTPPSHMSLFTSLYPSVHSVTGDTNSRVLDAMHTTLAESLRKKGYATGAVTEDGLLQADVGFERGFDHYSESKNIDLVTQKGQIETTFSTAAEWLAWHRAQPFFLFVHTYQVHDPYTPPPGYRGLFGPDGTTGPLADLDRYEEEVRYVDDQLARLWAQVRALGLAERTLLIVTSDHGEEFAEHGAVLHGSQLYDETLAVPLLMRAPGLVPQALRVAEQVGLMDVTPTVLALLGAAPLAQAQGLSLAPLFGSDARARSALQKALETRWLFAEAWAPFRVRPDGTLHDTYLPPGYALRSASLKVIWDRPVPPQTETARIEIYDLATDRAEQRDLAQGDAQRFRAEREALERYVSAAAPSAAAPQQPAAPVDPAMREKLHALGYLR